MNDKTKKITKAYIKTLVAIFTVILIIAIVAKNKTSTTQSQNTPSAGRAKVMCEKLALENLKSPSNVKFGGLLDGIEAKLMRSDKQGWHYFILNSWLEAQNQLGLIVRRNFSCQIRSKDNKNWNKVYLKLQ